MAKTKQRGYFKLKSANKWLHFSMNCWINLKQDSGKDIGIFAAEYGKLDKIDQFAALSDVAFAALKAYDQEEGNEIDYNVFQVRNWMEGMEEDEANAFVEAMSNSITMPVGKGKAKK